MERITSQIELDAGLRERAIAGIARLRRHLGEDWPMSDIARGHPVLEYFTNGAPWTRAHMAQLGAAMELLSQLEGWSSLLARLRQGRQGSGALLELELAYPPLVRGWGLKLEPATQPGRFADLMVWRDHALERQSLFIEAAIVDDFSRGARGDMSFQERLVPYLTLHLAGLDVGGRLLIDPTLEQEEELLAIADPFWQKCLERKAPAECVVPGILELWAVPLGDDQAKSTMLARGHQDGFAGGVIDNPLKRLLRVVRAKMGQLSLEEPGIIVLGAPPMLLPSFPLDVISVAVQQQLSDMPSVVGVGLIHWTMGRQSPAQRLSRQGDVLVLTIPDRSDLWKQVQLVVNPAHVQTNSVDFVLDLF